MHTHEVVEVGTRHSHNVCVHMLEPIYCNGPISCKQKKVSCYGIGVTSTSGVPPVMVFVQVSMKYVVVFLHLPGRFVHAYFYYVIAVEK